MLARLESNEAHIACVKKQDHTLMKNELERYKLLVKTSQPITRYFEQKPQASNQLILCISNVTLTAGVSDKIYPCRYVRVCDQMSCPVLNGRYVCRGTEVLCIGTDIDVLMDHDGVVRT
jgi:hypothetical protein